MSTESPSGARARCLGSWGRCLLGRKRPGCLFTAEGPACAKDSRQDIVGLLSKDKHSASLNAKHALSDGCVCVQVCPVVVVTPHDGFCYSSYGILYPPARAVTTAALHLPTSVKSLEEYLIFLVVNVFRQRFQLAGALGSASGSSVTQPCLARHQCCREPAAFRCFQ